MNDFGMNAMYRQTERMDLDRRVEERRAQLAAIGADTPREPLAARLRAWLAHPVRAARRASAIRRAYA
ncbi:hypothetical protein [Demequina mangrovi]|uniref:Uncharacterized protein n=1 Tax=Demequina mangrovi TaxID=1043493 RepID=A0A1H6UAI1_9MICO|nr:hypothetical protein [Demequina mangrovi]SEI89398.1 hypothetical protein SAMN05421637_0331 [Demequina mangrovi]